MSTALSPVGTPAAPATPAGPRPSLLRAEVHRFRSRRLIALLLVLGAVGFLGAVLLASTQYAKTSPEVLAEAQRRLDAVVVEQNAYREQCLSSPDVPQGVPADAYCGPEATAENFGGPENFIEHRPFTLATDGLAGALAVAVAASAVTFLVGATSIGAEWSSRSLVALLFWQPRRLRVMAAKLAVLAGAAALVGLLAQGGWVVAARVLAATRGSAQVPAGFWGDLLGTGARGVLLVVLTALLGFGVAHLVRNTAASLGAGFLYFAVVESAVRNLRSTWTPWLFTENALALVQHGGAKVYVDEGYFDAAGSYQSTGREVVLSNLHGGLVLGAVVLAVVGLGVLLFQRRDLN